MIKVASAELRTDEGCLFVELRLTSDQDVSAPIQVDIALHDDVAVAWRATIGCSLDDGSWKGSVEWARSKHPCLLQLSVVRDSNGQSIDPGGRHLFLEPMVAGLWTTGEPAEIERARLAKIHDERFNVPLVEAITTNADPHFAVLLLADNLYLSRPQQVPGINVFPVSGSTVGTDVAVALNEILPRFGFQGQVDPARWLGRVRERRPVVVIHAPRVSAADVDAAYETCKSQVRPPLDLLALRRGAKPTLLGGVVGIYDSGGALHYAAAWVEGTAYAGNMATGIISGEDPHGLIQQWDALSADPRSQLWLSLYADAIADERWDYRFFRLFGTLDGIATDIVPRGKAIVDPDGNPRLQDNGKNYTTDQLRGKVFELVRIVSTRVYGNVEHPAPWDPAGTFWDEVGVWVGVRNEVAHRGAWQLPRNEVPSPSRSKLEAEILKRGHGTIALGAAALEREIERVVWDSLRAALWSLL